MDIQPAWDCANPSLLIKSVLHIVGIISTSKTTGGAEERRHLLCLSECAYALQLMFFAHKWAQATFDSTIAVEYTRNGRIVEGGDRGSNLHFLSVLPFSVQSECPISLLVLKLLAVPSRENSRVSSGRTSHRWMLTITC